ncbi:MAG: hypothetical protein GYA14_04965 [Ignavibacteria bacterium]|nr:hypothetical protein [Ignavibacteria bacterium]
MMLKTLENYYKENGILSSHFICVHKKECKGDCKDFTGPKSSFVSSGYEKGKLPRLLFLSLDSGVGDEKPIKRTPIAVRKTEENRDVTTIPRNRHWFLTHEIALYILRKFSDEIKIEDDVKKYFAHVNSAKCCMNNPKNKKANKVLFDRCRDYLKKELKILKPKIIVTQGKEAKVAIEKFTTRTIREYDNYAKIILLNNYEIFWLHTSHPNDYGRFWSQRGDGRSWEKYSKIIYKWFQNIA